MSVRVPVAPDVLSWALDVTGADVEQLREKYKVDKWLAQEASPTLVQLQGFADATGIGLGYLLLTRPPRWTLPVPDFREGFATPPVPSADLIAVIRLSERRQDWYRDYVRSHGGEPLDFVGAARGVAAPAAAAAIRIACNFEVADRRGTWSDTRRALLRAFEALGGLTVATSMVGSNTRRLLDPHEFRGFALVDELAPLVFVNTNQTGNGQLFTIAHELAHVWRGQSGVGNEDPRTASQSDVERWCNAVASEVLVPQAELAQRYDTVTTKELSEVLDQLAGQFRCGTLVVLQALHRGGLRHFPDFAATYDAEVARLASRPGGAASGGDHYNNLPYRIGQRLSQAIVADTLEGRTSIEEAMALMSMKSLSTFNEYASRLGAA